MISVLTKDINEIIWSKEEEGGEDGEMKRGKVKKAIESAKKAEKSSKTVPNVTKRTHTCNIRDKKKKTRKEWEWKGTRSR